MCFHSPITRRMDIIRILVHLSYGMNFDSRENGGKKSFFGEIKASILRAPIKGTCFHSPIMKRVHIITRIHVHLTWWMKIDWKENDRKKSFSCKMKASPNEENVFLQPNHQTIWHYYENLWSSGLRDEHWF